MKKVKFDFCKKCKNIYNPDEWGQFLNKYGCVEFCCVDCGEDFIKDNGVIVYSTPRKRGL